MPLEADPPAGPDTKQASSGSLDSVILIHGTGAGERSHLNPKWWQAESEFARGLAQKTAHSMLAEPFCWNGANSERARRKAARALLERLRELDRRGQRYHLVAHSHGGSVVWRALVSSLAEPDGRLTGVRSWTTVGTPFLASVQIRRRCGRCRSSSRASHRHGG
jgi:pimeloyl-ACP methyl ester carboxylesterase